MTDPRSATLATPAGRSPLLSVRDLSVTFPQRGGSGVRAVRGISYDVHEGEFLGIVGESGSGKSVSSLAVMGLLPSNAQIEGDILFDGRSLLSGVALRDVVEPDGLAGDLGGCGVGGGGVRHGCPSRS